MDRFELQKLRDLPIEGVAERLGLRVERHKCLCPFHDDHRASLTFKNNKFKCWACGESGDSISLAEKMLGKGFVEACRWLADEHSVILTEYKPKEPNSSPKGGGWEGARRSPPLPLRGKKARRACRPLVPPQLLPRQARHPLAPNPLLRPARQTRGRAEPQLKDPL